MRRVYAMCVFLVFFCILQISIFSIRINRFERREATDLIYVYDKQAESEDAS